MPLAALACYLCSFKNYVEKTPSSTKAIELIRYALGDWRRITTLSLCKVVAGLEKLRTGAGHRACLGLHVFSIPLGRPGFCYISAIMGTHIHMYIYIYIQGARRATDAAIP